MSVTPLDALLAGFAPERTWLLPALQAVQADRGWLSPDDLRGVAAHLHVPASEVYGVATHYPELRLRPPGAHLVRVCTGVSCRIRGAGALLQTLGRRLGIEPGQTTADGRVTLEELDCAFACSVAPVVEIDHRCRSGPLAEEILDACRPTSGGHGPPGPAPDRSPTPAAPPGDRGKRPAAAAPLQRLATLVAAARRVAPGGIRLLVGTGTCGLARGAGETLDALRAAVSELDPATRITATVEEGACNGLCHAAPVVEVLRPGKRRLTVERVTPASVPALLALLRGERGHGLAGAVWADRGSAGLPPVARHPVLGAQSRHLAARWGTLVAGDLGDALRVGGYAALAGVLETGDPAAVTARVKAAGLLGRGGAYFPAAVKWEGCRAAAGTPRYLVANGEEGEPGIFKDRHVMEGDPHLLLEGMLLAAYAAGADRGILYVHGEADLSAARCARAVAEARAAGLLGAAVLGSGFSFEIEIRRGAGGFVLGEETALLESIEGRRAMPRPKPPFPVEAGIFGRPTVINNVETLSAVPLIVAGDSEVVRAKLFGLSGHLRRPGVVEVAPPVTLRGLVEGLGGGTDTGRPLGAVVVGGPSGVVVPPALLDRPLERPALSPGTGGVVALDDQVDLRDVVRTLLAFNARESCGKCTPCREGLPRLLEVLDGLTPATPDGTGLARLRELAEVVQAASLCGLGQAAPLALKAALDHFPGRVTGSPAAPAAD